MDTMLVIAIAFASLFTASFVPARAHSTSIRQFVVASPTPPADVCFEEGYAHKSEVDLAAMTPVQKINERLKHEFYHEPTGASDMYGLAVSALIRNDGIKSLPVVIEIADNYNPSSDSRCERLRFFVGFSTASDIDEAEFRLRGTKEGLATIEALERALQRMKGSDSVDGKQWREKNYPYYMGDLQRMKGRSVRDSIIQETLQVDHNIQLSDDQMLAFSNFLTLIDPSYPKWSEAKYGPPLVLKDSRKFYDAYRKFKKTKPLLPRSN